MEIVRLQMREPKVAHIPTFLIDTQRDDDWSARAAHSGRLSSKCGD